MTKQVYDFEVNAGRVFTNGKVDWPDGLRLHVPRNRAMTLAISLLEEIDRAEDQDFIRLPMLFGQLTAETEEEG